MSELIPIIRSLGFGAMLGAGLFGAIYITFFSELHNSEKDFFSIFLIVGSLFGGGAHSFIHQLIFKLILGPAYRAILFYIRLFEYRFNPLISPKQKKRLINELIESYHEKIVSELKGEKDKKSLSE